MPQPRRQRRGGNGAGGAGSGRRTPRTRARGGSDLGNRVLVAVPALAVALTMVALGGTVFVVGVGVLGLICLHELFSMFERARPARLAGFVGYVGLLAAASLGDRDTILLAFVACLPVVFFVAANQRGGAGAPGISVTVLGLAWIGLAFAHAVLLRDLDHGGGLVFAVLLGTFVGDTAAYLGGRAFGQRKLAPTISPNKTIEGLAIGIVVATAAVWWAGLSQTWMGGTKGAVLGVAIALSAPIGDLFESYLKRDAGTKDTGTLFGAHGGALDRLDAVMFTAVTGYYVWLALKLSVALRGGLVGVALGEALGLPWTGAEPRRISRAKLYDEVGATGAVTRAVLAAAGGGASDDAGGGLPDALVLGWREDDPLARRAAALHLGFAPVMVADLAAWALAGEPLYHLVADHADDWPPPFHGVAADDRSILDALLAILHRHDDPSEGMRAAVRLGGGGAATLTALVGGLLGCRRPTTALERVPWRERVTLPEDAALDSAVAALMAL